MTDTVVEQVQCVNAGDDDRALILVDIQNDFCPGGALAVKDGDSVVRVANALLPLYRNVVATQDWHPAGHRSFASTHGLEPFAPIDTPGLGPVLWPDHCIAGSRGADFHPKLNLSEVTAIIRKGTRPEIDSYSAFLENDGKTPTGLDGFLRNIGIRRLLVMGLATDFCVFHTVKDAISLGYNVDLIIDGCRGVNGRPDWGHSIAMETMESLGAVLVEHLGLLNPVGR